jgi:hypothetical protein
MDAQSSGPAFTVHVDDGQWGAVFLGGLLDCRPALFLLAVGERHPGAPWRPSVYEIAHRRLERRSNRTAVSCSADRPPTKRLGQLLQRVGYVVRVLTRRMVEREERHVAAPDDGSIALQVRPLFQAIAVLRH